MKDKIISITGNTATGTTTLTRQLHDSLGWIATYSEDFFKNNLFFAKFLQNPQRWAFPSQISFIMEYFEGYRTAIQLAESQNQIVCLDYIIYELVIYSDAMLSMRYIDADEYITVKRLLDLLEPMLRPPDLIIYLTTDIDVLVERSQKRGRFDESYINKSYLEALQKSFDSFIGTWTTTPILKFDTEKFNFLLEPDVMRSVATQILDIILN